MSHQVENSIIGSVYAEKKHLIPVGDSYAELLDHYKLEKNPTGVYWREGTIERTQGWILHLSVVKHELTDMLKVVVPFLLERQITFKVPQSIDCAQIIIEGGTGYVNLAKMVCIYPSDDVSAVSIASSLIGLTQRFRGPAIPTDVHLGGVVYTRYGSFGTTLLKDVDGQLHKGMYDSKGALIADPYRVPFALPEGNFWPFNDLTGWEMPRETKLLHSRYFPVNTVKADAKGNVFKAVYFEKLWKISTCIIKEGKKNMFSDDHGRDIRDRLKWQYTLHKDLQADIPMPRLIDFFEQNERSYLVLELIKGVSLNDWLEDRYAFGSWKDISAADKMLILDMALRILGVIDMLHRRGYLHRDLTPGNILVGKKGEINLIDLELAWSINENMPNPPFKLGTPGFMSPEQEVSEPPTLQQDLFAVGALLLNMFINMNPIKIIYSINNSVADVIAFLTGNTKIAELLEACVHKDANRRPSMSFIMTTVKAYRNQLLEKPRMSVGLEGKVFNKPKELHKTVQAAVDGMEHPGVLTLEGCWVSTDHREDRYIKNQQIDLGVKVGWHTGLSGPLWLVAKLKLAGYQVDSAMLPYKKSWEYVKNFIGSSKKEEDASLYTGNAGIALALSAGLSSGLLSAGAENIHYLACCFLQEARPGGLRSGLAGQGMALLSSRDLLPAEMVEDLLTQYIARFVSTQLPDGSWPFFQHKGKTIPGLSRGVAGATWFLLACLSFKKDDTLKPSIERALLWLSKNGIQKGGLISKKGQQSQTPLDFLNASHGTAGVVLTFIKAYELFGDVTFKRTAEDWLGELPERILTADFSFYSGLAGLGEVYLEAALVFNEQKWKNRAGWISELFVNAFQRRKNGSGFWVTGDLINITMDLFTGNSGIIHFLMRAVTQQRLPHPFWVSNQYHSNICAQTGEAENL